MNGVTKTTIYIRGTTHSNDFCPNEHQLADAPLSLFLLASVLEICEALTSCFLFKNFTLSSSRKMITRKAVP